jgi:hypothetical protein
LAFPLIQTGGGGSASSPAFTRNPQTGTSYAIQNSDSGKTVELSNATASTIIALTIAQAGAAGAFANNWYCVINNIGQNAARLTPTTSTIGGAATLFIPPGCCVLVYSDGTNYQIEIEGANSAASSGQGGFASWGLLSPTGIASSNIVISGSANQLKGVQFCLHPAQVVRRAAFWIGTTAAAGKLAFVGMYDANKNKIFQASFSTTTASTKVVDSSFTSVILLPGVYYYMLSCDSTTVTTDTLSPASGSPGLLQNNTSPKMGTAANPVSSGVLPATLGTITFAAISAGQTWFEA